MKRRSNLSLNLSILQAVCNGKTSPTRITQTINSQYSQCKNIIFTLVDKGFLTIEHIPYASSSIGKRKLSNNPKQNSFMKITITEKGIKLIQTIKTLEEMLGYV